MALVDTTTGEIIPPLADLEAVIEKGMASFVAVGDALMVIRDQRLYRDSHRTFEDYCSERWGFRASRARQLIGAAQTVTTVTVGGGPAPTSERQARALAPVKDNAADAAEAMRRAHEATAGKPTAEAIVEAVADVVASKERHKQDAEELQNLMDEVNPEDFDPQANAEAVRQRGEFARLCRDLTKLPDPAAFVKGQGAELRERHITYAENAYRWLDEFLLTVREEA